MEIDTLEGIIALLAPSIGEHTARSVVTREAAKLGLGAQLTSSDGTRLLRQIEMLSGPAGLAARLALVRARRARMESVTMPSVSDPPDDVARSFHGAPGAPEEQPSVSQGKDAVPVADLAALFAKSLGESVADALVKQAMARLGVHANRTKGTILRRDAALILDHIEAEGGVAGAVARFAKVRFLLKYA